MSAIGAGTARLEMVGSGRCLQVAGDYSFFFPPCSCAKTEGICSNLASRFAVRHESEVASVERTVNRSGAGLR